MDWNRAIKQVATLLATQEGLKTSFTWQKQTLWGVRTNLKKEVVNSDGGLVDIYAFSLLCPASLFGSKLPTPRQDKIKLEDGAEMRILSIDTDSVKGTIRLNLGDVTA